MSFATVRYALSVAQPAPSRRETRRFAYWPSGLPLIPEGFAILPLRRTVQRAVMCVSKITPAPAAVLHAVQVRRYIILRDRPLAPF
jgi:hypothetical protein